MVRLDLKETVFQAALCDENTEKPFSEDGFLRLDGLTVVFDGATGLSTRRLIKSGHSDPEWFVSTLIRRFKSLAVKSDDPKKLVGAVLKGVIKDYEKEVASLHDIEKYEQPSSTMLLAMPALDGKRVVLSCIADGLVCWKKKKGGFGFLKPSETLAELEKKFGERINAMVEKGKSAAEIDAAVLEVAKKIRNTRNQAGSYGALDPGLDIIKHPDFKVVYEEFEDGDRILMTTDGLLRYCDVYGQGGYEEMMDLAFSGSLAEIAARVREIESRDFKREKYKRFKVSDDICAVTLEVGNGF